MTMEPSHSPSSLNGDSLNSSANNVQWTERVHHWQKVITRGLAENNSFIHCATLHDGWDITQHRAQVLSGVLAEFFHEFLNDCSPTGTVAIYQLGGTGRGEMCPDSDIDLAVFVENIAENERFLEELCSRKRLLNPIIPQLGETLKTNSFHDLKNRNHFDLTMLRSMLDATLITGHSDFHERIIKQCNEQGKALNLELVFDTIARIRDLDKKHPQKPGDIGEFHIKDGQGGQRNFQLPIWLLGFADWKSAKSIYALGNSGVPGAPGSDVQTAAGILLMTRSWLALRKSEANGKSPSHRKYILDEDAMYAFAKRFGGSGVRLLNEAREQILHFRDDSIDLLLEQGVSAPGTNDTVRFGLQGLSLQQGPHDTLPSESFFQLYQTSQRYDIPIERSTGRVIRSTIARTIEPHELFLDILAAPGTIAKTLTQWKSIGVLPQLLPGFDLLSESFYKPEHRTASLMKDARAIQRIENLDQLEQKIHDQDDTTRQFFFDQLQSIDMQTLLSIRLALLIEEIPDTLYSKTHLPQETIEKYLEKLSAYPGMRTETLSLTNFLIKFKRDLLSTAEQSADPEVLAFWNTEIERLPLERQADAARALALFAYAAFDFEPVDKRLSGRLSEIQWKNIRTLCENLIHIAEGITGDSFLPEYFDGIGRRIGLALPESLKQGPMLTKTIKRFGSFEWDYTRAHPVIENLARVLKTAEPRLELSFSGGACELALYGFNQPGLFWKVTSVLHELDAKIRFTELYPLSIKDEYIDEIDEVISQLVVDYITFTIDEKTWSPTWRDLLLQRMHERIREPSTYIPDETPELISRAADSMAPRLTTIGNGKLKFSFQSLEHHHLLYAVSRTLSEKLEANISSVSEDGTHDWAVTRMNVYFTSPLTHSGIQQKLTEIFGEIECLPLEAKTSGGS